MKRSTSTVTANQQTIRGVTARGIVFSLDVIYCVGVRKKTLRAEGEWRGGVVIENCCQPQQAAKLISNLAPNRACLPVTGMLRASRRLAVVRSTRGLLWSGLEERIQFAEQARTVRQICTCYGWLLPGRRPPRLKVVTRSPL